MTIQSRNRFLQIFALISLLMNAFLLYKLSQIYSDIQNLYDSVDIVSQKWWFIKGKWSYFDWRVPILTLFSLSILGLLGNGLLNIYFRKSSSQEMYYFRVFLIALSFSSIRSIDYFLILKHFGANYSVIITRGAYFLRLLGLGSLLLSGIAIFDKKFQRMSTIFLSVLITAFIISVIIPVNQEFILGSCINSLTDELTFFMFFMVLQLLILMNFILYAYYRKSRDNIYMALGIFIILFSHELAFFGNPIGLILSIILMPIGIFLFSRKIFNLYLWR